MLRLSFLTVALVTVAACGSDGGSAPVDAAVADAPPVIADAAPLVDAAAVWVDFTASGCTPVADSHPDAPPVRCRGTAPLAVRFAALAPGPVATWAWTFGDAPATPSNPASTDAAPAHTYALPGRYDVSVSISVAGSDGTATAARAGFIEVVGAPLAAACELDAQCLSATCLCGRDESCPALLSSGMCTAACGAGCTGAVCAVLGAGTGEPWAGEHCLAPCSDDDDCPDGRTCEVVASAGGGWVRACLPAAAFASLGDSCAGPAGPVDGDDARCATGDCLGAGVRGLCTVTCGPTAPCPGGAHCATFGSGVRACLLECTTPGDACSDDPWLGCEAPGASGPWGFTLDGGAAVCAPRRCTGSGGCPGGACVAGHCQRDPA